MIHTLRCLHRLIVGLLPLLASGCPNGSTDSGTSVDSTVLPPDAGTDASPATDSNTPDTDSGSYAVPTPLTLRHWLPVVDVATLSEPPLPFVIDTGAPITVLDSDSYAGAAGELSVDVTAFGTTVTGVDVVRFDLFGPNPPGPFQDIGGMIGSDFLVPWVLTLDYQNLGAYLFDASTGTLPVDANVEPATTVPFQLLGGGTLGIPGDGSTTVGPNRIIVDGLVEGVPIVILLDTGARHSIIDAGLFASLGDPSRPVLQGVNVQQAGGIVEATVSRVSSLSIGGTAVTGATVIVIPGTGIFSAVQSETGAPVELLLGGTYLRYFLTTYDYPGLELLLARFSAPSHVDPNEWIGPGFEVVEDLVGSVYLVNDVYTGTDAEAAGVIEGSILSAVDGTAASMYSLAELRNLMTTFTVGTYVDFGITVGMTTTDLPVLIEDLLPQYP